MEVPFSMTTGMKVAYLGTEGMQRRTLRCAKCGEDAGARNNAWLKEQRPRPRSPDQCCHIGESGKRCGQTLTRGKKGNVTDNQWRKKQRGDRRCRKCTQLHADSALVNS